MIGDLSLAGQVTLPASRSVRTLLVNWPFGIAGAWPKSVCGDPATVAGAIDPRPDDHQPPSRQARPALVAALSCGGLVAVTDGSDGQPSQQSTTASRAMMPGAPVAAASTMVMVVNRPRGAVFCSTTA